MEIDPMESAESAEGAHSRLNAWVAITVALLATFMGICKVKDDNIVQAMQQAQADKIDHWSFYQARNIRQEIAQASLAQLAITRAAAAPAQRPRSIQRSSNTRRSSPIKRRRRTRCAFRPSLTRRPTIRSTIATTSSISRTRSSRWRSRSSRSRR